MAERQSRQRGREFESDLLSSLLTKQVNKPLPDADPVDGEVFHDPTVQSLLYGRPFYPEGSPEQRAQELVQRIAQVLKDIEKPQPAPGVWTDSPSAVIQRLQNQF